MAKVATQIRLEDDLHEILKRIAEQENRSLNNLMEYLLRKGTEEYSSK